MERSGGSKLMQMQAKFQQKQLQERELKIASLYEAQQARALDRVRHSPASGAGTAGTGAGAGAGAGSPPPQPAVLPVHPGKVRQMFEERRTKAGIDKSYPLQPIHNTDRPAARKNLTNGHTKVTSTRTSMEKKATKSTTSHSVRKQQYKSHNIVNGSGDLNHNHELDLNSVKHALPKTNGEIFSIDELDKAENNYLIENETFPEALAPMTTPRSPEPQPEPKRPPRRSPAAKASPVTKSQPVAPPRRVASDNAVADSKPRGAMQRVVNPIPPRRQPVVNNRQGFLSPSTKRTATAAPAPAPSSASDGASCAVCGRRFAPDRLAKHQEICKKANNKKRKPFDALKHRLAGTEAEQFIGKLRRHNNASSNPSSTKVAKPLNNNWRQKHEEFISAIRAAKQVQAHLNAGGKLSDLPPPPPSENPDYVPCPHCGRRFNQSAAERHIPKCASYQFNKPKPTAAASKKR